jgi:hypothetical protein
MKAKDSWTRLEERAGTRLIKAKKQSPAEKIMEIGKTIKSRKRLEAQKLGIPKYNPEQKERILENWIKLSEEFENAEY